MKLEELRQMNLSDATAKEFFFYEEFPKKCRFERGKAIFQLSSFGELKNILVPIIVVIDLICSFIFKSNLLHVFYVQLFAA